MSVNRGQEAREIERKQLRAREIALPGKDLQHKSETQCSNPKTYGNVSWVWTLPIFPGVGDRDKDFPKQAGGPD